jgi:GTP pyrophosphokinase
MDTVVEQFGFKSVEDLIASVGYGKITPLQVVRKFLPKTEAETDQHSIFERLIGKVRKKKDTGGVLVRGIDDMLVRFAKCCRPVPGDPIVGYITRGQGVTVHRTSCVNALNMNPERRIEVAWNQETIETYPVRLLIRSLDRVGLLADLASNINQSGANILSANTETRDNQLVDSYFTIAVENTLQLKKVIAAVRRVRLVQGVKRIEG